MLLAAPPGAYAVVTGPTGARFTVAAGRTLRVGAAPGVWLVGLYVSEDIWLSRVLTQCALNPGLIGREVERKK